VRISHAGINPVDTAVRAGWFALIGAPPFTVGWDISGTVEAVGKDVSQFKVGDTVFGMPRFPKQAAAYAEYVTAPANELALKPESLGFAEAGALPLAGLTAWQALVNATHLKLGQKVLILAAAGGVGHIAVQIARAQGAHVVATTSAKKRDYAKSIGADQVIDYAADDFTTLPADFDVVLDPIAGEQAERSLKVLKRGGHLLCLLDPSAAAR
jgi:NADPH:quinone reductase-like Zn-dependent oxidoreductase